MYGELASVKGVVDLSPQDALDRAEAFLASQGYAIAQRTYTTLTAQRRAEGEAGEQDVLNLTVAVAPQPDGGVRMMVRGNDQTGVRERQAAWMEWSESLPKKPAVEPAEAGEQDTGGTVDLPLPPPPQAESADLAPPPHALPNQVPTPQAPPRQRRSLRFWAVLGAGGCLVLVLLLVGLVGGLALLGNGSGGGGAPSGGVPVGRSNSGETFTNETYAELYSAPRAHKGASVDVAGQLLERPEDNGDELAFQMFADPENADWNTVVYTDQTDLDLNTDDYVRVQGEVLGSFDGENAFGGSITTPTIQASKVTTVSAGQAIDPAKKVSEINRTLGNGGFDVTLQKIEFGEDSTRAYVAFTNNTDYGASFYTFDAKIQQGSTQVDYLEDSYAYYDDEPQEELGPGVRTEGIIAFGPVDPDQPFVLTLPWTSNNYNLKTKPVVFQVTP